MISSAALAALMAGDQPHAVLDLREPAAYERGHVFRTTSLPRRLLETRLPALVPDPATPVILCDADGELCARARPLLSAMGYRAVRTLEGGLGAWRTTGRPLVQGWNVPSKVFGEQVLHQLGTPEITPVELAAALARGDDLVLVDARTPEEYRRGCVPGAFSVPGGELALRVPELLAGPGATVVVHCGGRTRSYLGVESLRRAGLPNRVVALANGTMGWELAGLALERGAGREAPPVSARGRERAREVARQVAAEDGLRAIGLEALRAPVSGRYVFDVRTAEEYGAGHVPGSTWAPGGQLVQATDEYVAVRAAPIVLVCDGLVRSVLTAAWLGRMGFPDVSVLAGGLPAWEAAGGPIERGHAVPLPFGYAAARARVPRVAPGSLGAARAVAVEPSDAYARGHVPGAAWLCRSRLEERIGAVVPDRTGPLVVTCGDGIQSTLAAATLGELGYRAGVLEGGIQAWAAAGLPLETGATRLADEADDVVRKAYDRGPAAMVAYLRWEEALDAEGRSPHALLPDETRRP